MSVATALIPERIEAPALSQRRTGVAFGSRFMLLLIAGLVWLGPAFLDLRFFYALVAWDTLLFFAWAYDLLRLPSPPQLTVTRVWRHPAALAVENEIELNLTNRCKIAVHAEIADDVPAQLRDEIPQVEVSAASMSEGSATYKLVPALRGDAVLGDAYMRYQSPWRLAERWSRVPLSQKVRVYPNLEEANRHAIYMVRSRQIEMQKRYMRMKGSGREFESLREYRDGDELRNICWTASARRAKLVTRTFQVERSQTIWMVLDCGRLMRTRVGSISKLDAAVNTALSLTRVAMQAGDRVGMLAYGRAVQQRLLPGTGSHHLRQIMEQLVDVHEEPTEADHLRAVSVLLSTQRRRSLVVWLTDLAETAMIPEVVDSAMQLLPQQLVLFVVIGQPDLAQAALREPKNADDMFQAAAAQEVMHRREVLLARMQERGALAIEVNSAALSSTVVNAYLDIKQRNQL
jgi:uncharacterized protein (DUF58 family)